MEMRQEIVETGAGKPQPLAELRVGNKPLAEYDNVILEVAKLLIKSGCTGIASPHHQIDLRAAEPQQRGFSFVHQAAAEPGALKAWMNGQIVDGTTMSIIAKHHRSDHRAAELGDEKAADGIGQLSVDVL